MIKRSPLVGVALGSILLALASPAMAQSNGGALALPLAVTPPLPHSSTPAPKKEAPLVAAFRVESTELGYEKSVAPAPGHKLIYKGHDYIVADVVEPSGGPTFGGNSRHVIATSGATLMVGLMPLNTPVASLATGTKLALLQR